MKIADAWRLEDSVSGVKIRIICGEYLNRLHIEIGDMNRDFFFAHDGTFDGTGMQCRDASALGETYRQAEKIAPLASGVPSATRDVTGQGHEATAGVATQPSRPFEDDLWESPPERK